MKKVLVTGGVGFIGTNLSLELLKCGYKVIVLDDLSTGRQENADDIVASGGMFIKGSITDLELLQRACSGVDYVFHLAAINRVPLSIENPVLVNQVNVIGTLNVLVASRDNMVKKVIYASSSSIYGGGKPYKKAERLNPNPESPYSVSKLVGEYYCNVFQKVYGLHTVSLRYQSVYGRRQRTDIGHVAVIPIFIDRAKKGLSLVIYGDGKQTRDFIFVDDIVEANIKFAENNAIGVFNVGTGKSTSINALAKLISDIMGVKHNFKYEPPRAGDVKHGYADVAESKSFGYVPKTELDDGLKITCEWFNKR